MPGSIDAGMMVNIYGTDDPLVKHTDLVGHRASWANFTVNPVNAGDKPLFNIEIEGADHYDYILGIDPKKKGDAFTKNEIISRFVAQLIVNAASEEDLKDFLDNPPTGVLVNLLGERYYRIELGF